MTATEQLAATDVAFGTFDFSDDGRATWYEVPGISTLDIPEAVPDSTSTNYLKGTVKRASKAAPPDVSVGISVYQPQRQWARKWFGAAETGKDLQCRFTTQEILEFDSGTGTIAFDASGDATFAVVSNPDLSGIVPGYIVKVGDVIRIIEEVDPDAGTMKVSAPDDSAPTVSTAAVYKIYEPSQRWSWTGKPSRPGFSGGADAPIGTSNLTSVPRSHLGLPTILIPA